MDNRDFVNRQQIPMDSFDYLDGRRMAGPLPGYNVPQAQTVGQSGSLWNASPQDRYSPKSNPGYFSNYGVPPNNQRADVPFPPRPDGFGQYGSSYHQATQPNRPSEDFGGPLFQTNNPGLLSPGLPQARTGLNIIPPQHQMHAPYHPNYPNNNQGYQSNYGGRNNMPNRQYAPPGGAPAFNQSFNQKGPSNFGPAAGTGGSNAQGRAVNKILLDILKERTIDPQRLDIAIETYCDRMDCVNLATLLFHTGKKRLLLQPLYIRRIANRFLQVKEELRAREASNALYGLKCMSSELPEVRELVFALATKLSGSSSDFVAQAVGNALYGLQMMSSEHEEVRFLLNILAVKVTRCTELLEAQNVGNALYGLRNMSSDHKEIRTVIAALAPKIASAKEDLNGQALGNSLYGLQSMSSKEPEVRYLLTVLAAKVPRTWEDLKAQEVGNALYGLKRMNTDVAEVRTLIGALVPKIASSPDILDAQAIGNSFYGLQNMRSDNPEVLSLLEVMAEKVRISPAELDGQAMGNSLYGLQGMNSDFPAVRAVIAALTIKIQNSCLDMNAQELGNALYGLQNMTSDYMEVRRLLGALTHKVNSSKHDLTGTEIGYAIFGLQGMSSSAWETRMLIRQLAIKIQQSHSSIDAMGISNSLFGLQKMSSESEDVRLLVQALAIKIEHCWKMLSAQHIANAMFGIQGLSSQENEVKYLIRALTAKILACREEFTSKQLSLVLFGLRSFSSEQSEVLSLVTAIAEKLSQSNEGWHPSQLAMALYGVQGLSTQSEEVRTLMSVLAFKAVNMSPEIFADGNDIGNALFGLQRMDCSDEHVLMILQVLSSRLHALKGFVSAKSGANMIYGLHSYSCRNEVVRSLVQRILEIVENISSSAVRACSSPPIEPFGIASNRQLENMEDIHSLYIALTLCNFAMPDLDNDQRLKGSFVKEINALETVMQRRKGELQQKILSVAEVRLSSELSDVLELEPFSLSIGCMVHGFPMCTLVELPSNITLETVSGQKWAPVLNIEVRGSSFSFPSKDLFFNLRNAYLERERGVTVKMVPSDSFRIDGQNGLKVHSAALSALYPPSPEDHKKFEAALSLVGYNSKMGLLNSSHVFTFNSSRLDSHCSPTLHADYHDDDLLKPGAQNSITSRSAVKYPSGLPFGWSGDWPVFATSLTGSISFSKKAMTDMFDEPRALAQTTVPSPVFQHRQVAATAVRGYDVQINDLANTLLLNNSNGLVVGGSLTGPALSHQQLDFGGSLGGIRLNGGASQHVLSDDPLRASDDDSSKTSKSGDGKVFEKTIQRKDSYSSHGSTEILGQRSVDNVLMVNTSLSGPKSSSSSSWSTDTTPRFYSRATPSRPAHHHQHSHSQRTDALGVFESLPESKEDVVDDEIAALEAQLEVARLEAKLKELKSKKVTKPV